MYYPSKLSAEVDTHLSLDKSVANFRFALENAWSPHLANENYPCMIYLLMIYFNRYLFPLLARHYFPF